MAPFILRHKLLVVVAWITLSGASIATIGQLGPRLDYTYTTPGEPGYEANFRITQRFGLDAEFEATLPVLQLPEGLTMDSPRARARRLMLVTRRGPLPWSITPIRAIRYLTWMAARPLGRSLAFRIRIMVR